MSKPILYGPDNRPIPPTACGFYAPATNPAPKPPNHDIDVREVEKR